MSGNYKRIAVVPDPTAEAQPALARAAELARTSGASLELIGIDYNEHIAGERLGDSVDLAAARAVMIERRARWLETLAKLYRSNQLEVHCHSHFGHPLHQAIVDAAAEIEPDLLVKDTHYHAPLSRTLFSNTDWELMRRCPFELLLVKPRPWSSPVRVVAAVDPMHDADTSAALDHSILREGRALADVVGGELHVVHACPEAIATGVPGYVGPAVLMSDDVIDHIEQAHRRAVARLLSDHQVDGVHITSGPAALSLVEQADALSADVMVVGAVSRGGLRRRFIGHTARQALDQLPCDLLLVKLED